MSKQSHKFAGPMPKSILVASEKKEQVSKKKTAPMRRGLAPDKLGSLVRGLVKESQQPLKVAETKGTDALAITRNVSGSRDMLRASLGSNNFRTRIFTVASQVNGTISTALATVLQANLVTATEWSTFSALFDEARCRDVKLTLFVQTGNTSSGSLTLALVTWDQDDVSPLTSIATGMAATRRSGPHVCKAIGFDFPIFASRSQGFSLSSGKLRSGFPDEASGTPVAYPVRGDWVSTSASTAIVGFFKPYIEAENTVTFSYRAVFEYDVEFRLRS